MVGKCLHDKDLDDTPLSFALFCSLEKALQQFHNLNQPTVCTLVLIPGQEHPGQGDVLEFTQIAKIIFSGQVLLPYPVEGFIKPPQLDPNPCF
ncbi:hypothetical protein D3C75_935810 [compost metagenome]